MSQTDIHENFEDTLEPPSTSTSQATLLSSNNSTFQPQKKRRLDDSTAVSISDYNQAKFRVLKKLRIQLTRTKRHINYLTKCDKDKIVPRSLRVNLIPQVPVINSVLQLIDIEIDIEILFFVEYSQTCNISPVGLLFRQTRVKQQAKNITACNKKNNLNGRKRSSTLFIHSLRSY